MRMEDLDPAREPPQAAQQILDQTHAYGMEWDGEVLYQSERQAAYNSALQSLQREQLCYFCDCSRQQIKSLGSVYPGLCRDRSAPILGEFAVRIKTPSQHYEFDDAIQGLYGQNLFLETGDFVLRRKDGLIAYQLAVVVDDAFQNITHVVRGVDLIDSTPRQLYLQQVLGYQPVQCYAHIPVIVNELQQKLSKQHFAQALNIHSPTEVQENLHQALMCLGLPPAPQGSLTPVAQQISWGIEHWDVQQVPKVATLEQPCIFPDPS